MASGESFMANMIKRTARGLNNQLHSNEPVSVVDAFKQAIDSRMGIWRNNGETFSRNPKMFKAVGGKEKNLGTDTKALSVPGQYVERFEEGPSNWQRLKSLGYNLDGTVNYGRTAGMAVGFGGGAIAGLNLAADIVS